MSSLLSNFRLAAGCCALFGGLLLINARPDESGLTAAPRLLGTIVSGMGLAVAARELAYQHARFMKSKDE